MKVLFVTLVDVSDPTYGGAKGSKSRYDILKRLCDVELCTIGKISSFSSVMSIVEGIYPPLRRKTINDIIDKIERDKYELIFVDNSVLGKLVYSIKKQFPKVPVISYFQNCEYDWIGVRFINKNRLQSIVYRYLVKQSEQLSIKHSDRILALSRRDKFRLDALYGNSNAEIVSLFLTDEAQDIEKGVTDETYCLLFGPALPANVEAFDWFTKNVSPYINIKTLIAGKGFEKMPGKYDSNHIEVVGYVEKLEDVYSRAAFVCIPLLRGGGMKIKTAEAMMFGKWIYGSEEAFSGYDIDISLVGGICDTPEEYIEKINNHISMGRLSNNENSRRLFEENYSEESALNKYRDILDYFKNIN